MSASGLPIELVCSIIEFAAVKHRDTDLAWTANLAVIHTSSLKTARSAIYELYIVGRLASKQNDRNRDLEDDRSIRELVRMLMNATDPRRAHVKCIVFAMTSTHLGLEKLVGCRWAVDTVVWDDGLHHGYFPSGLQIRRLIDPVRLRVITADGSVCLHSAEVWYDVDVALQNTPADRRPTTYWHIPVEGDEVTPDLLRKIVVRSVVTVFPPKIAAPGGSTTQPTSHEKVARTVQAWMQTNATPPGAELRWSNNGWRWGHADDSESHREFLCGGGRWDDGEPL